ncbi:regulatory protein RecX [Microlunatus parietis]|uniref:Regulatory protein RecX n=1 Tax=Microlunatus parietis TaxID=682979 RepID=A0A7Y9I371_9ACTN|nr:regulatory protein RecX [Microlunatus parietis]NYE69338.1 regulatory protein [Microlunatus parietis]
MEPESREPVEQRARTARSSRRPGRRRRTEEPAERHDGPDADPEATARSIVLRKLTGQARTRQELADALADRDVPDDAAGAVLDRMEEVGLVDDRGFARDWVESRQSRRQLSRSAIRRELTAKGVDRDHIDEALAEVDDSDELGAARALAEKKVRSMSKLEPQVRYRRLAGALARRGFPSHVTTQVLDEVLSDQSDS